MDWTALPDVVHQWALELLAWVGFGTLVGLLAKAVLPGRDSGGPLATLVVGIGGTIIGAALLTFLWAGHRVSPLSPLGFVAGVAGAALLLMFHRMLGGAFFREEGTGTTTKKPRRRAVVLTKE